MTPPDPEALGTDGSRLHFPALKWATAFVLALATATAMLSWLAWANVREWEWNRLAQAGVSARVAEDRVAISTNNARILNEMKLQTLNSMLPDADKARMIPMLLARLDEETRRSVLSLKLRALQVIGEQQGLHVEQRGSRVEQQGGYVEPQRPRSQAP